jgi:hypothetical protein
MGLLLQLNSHVIDEQAEVLSGVNQGYSSGSS